MSNPSNLYAEKIFAEHPQHLWALDDQLDYVSIISETNRNLQNWSIDNGTSTLTEELLDAPFPDSVINKVNTTTILPESFYVKLVSPSLINVDDLNTSLSTFSIGTYFYTNSPYVLGVDIGYQYYDDALESYIDVLKPYDISIKERWMFISETFSPDFSGSDIKLVIKIKYLGESSNLNDYISYFNGITFGQWCEEFQSSSLGISTIDLPSSIELTTSKVIEADSYGLFQNPGYYFINDNALVAKNFGIPMVFGSQSITKLYNNNNKPSLIVPSLGMMSNVGRYKDYTLEFWLRTNNSSSVAKRIVGPISSDDGIYIDGPFIVLKINESYSSYYVGQWERPMLIHWKYTNNSSSVMLNGEDIINISIDSNSIVLEDELSENNKTQTWIGFYAYENIEPIEIDCIAIYQYLVPSLVAKRRFVFGQGVEYPQNLNAVYGGNSVVFDYSFSDYSKNYNYPDLGSWNQASIDNLIIEDNCLTVPNVASPVIITNSTVKKQNELLLDQNISTSPLYLKLKPNTSWNNINSYLYIDNFSLSAQQIHAFYGVFKKEAGLTGSQVLIRIEDNSSNYFSIECVENDVRYILKYGTSAPTTIYESLSVSSDEPFTVGIEIDVFKDYFGQNVMTFFTNQSTFKVYIGGTKEFTKTFTGNIYKFGLCSEKNVKDVADLFNQLGVPKDYENIFNLYGPGIEYDGGDSDQDFWNYYVNYENPFDFMASQFIVNELLDHTPSIGFTPKKYFNTFYLDSDISGSWKDYVPLSYFGQNVLNEYGDQQFGLDFIQFNINYPAPVKFKETELIDEDGWSYSELASQYSYPQQRTYESLDNYLFTGYIDYQDLAQKSIKTYSYDTSDSIIKTYITFEYLESGANASSGFFIKTEDVPKNGVIQPGSDWINTKYEVVDNIVIYPPKGADPRDLAMVVHIEFMVNGVKYQPIKIKNLQLASQAFNYSSPNNIGTRFGTNVYPYKNTGYYFNYKSKNPFTIYKGSSPYLYLTRYSGLEIKGDYDPLINRGIAIPVNSNKTENYEVMAMQTLLRFNGDFFPYAPTEIMQINAKNKIIKLYLVASHPTGKRAKIYAIDGNSGALYNALSFYLNGKIVKEPILNINEWSMLGIGFSNILNFKSYSGSIMINGPIIFNNLSYYQTTNLQEVQNVNKRPWARVKFASDGLFDWEYWNDYYLWQGVLVQSSTSYYGVNPEDLYKAYTGTNKIIIDDDKVFGIQGYEYSVYKDISWQSQISDAV